MDLSLRLPFNGNFPVTFAFGAQPDSEVIKEKFQQWGIIGHNGIDYSLPEGEEVVAAATGRVLQAGENGDFGISVTLGHPWGQSLYAHLKETKVSLSQEVKEGEVIGLSGQTGSAFGAHLHFGIKPNDSDAGNGYHGFVDPSPYLPSHPSQEGEKTTATIPQPQIVERIVKKEIIKEVPVEKIIEKEVIRPPTQEELKEAVKKFAKDQLSAARQSKAQKRQERLGKIYAYIKEHGQATNRELRRLFHGLSESTITNYLDELERQGKIRQVSTHGRAIYQPR